MALEYQPVFEVKCEIGPLKFDGTDPPIGDRRPYIKVVTHGSQGDDAITTPEQAVAYVEKNLNYGQTDGTVWLVKNAEAVISDPPKRISDFGGSPLTQALQAAPKK